MARAQTLVAGRQFAEALAQLEKTERPSGNHGATWTLLKAEAAAGAGNREQALRDAASKARRRAGHPRGRALATIRRRRSARQPRDVAADIWRLRDARADAGAPFALTSLRDGTPVQLADFRGRVVLVAFWYPT